MRGRTVPSKRKLSATLQRWMPRLLALYWAKFSIHTTYAYISLVPPQLAQVDGVTPIPLWLVWSAPAVILVLGVFIPPCASTRAQNVARWLRIGGCFLLTVGMIIWSSAFYLDPPRGWVSGKNYEALAVMLAFTTWFIARDETGRKRVMRE
ncbi:Uncharacterised protein [Corynebacterium imitans]|uniref:Uncharacterized protein n=1 Tax=Corynebacterium imitans TaxID=156978 RepID=A0A076NNX4_9CORY|nr:hypothetical protein CIMIT_05790 [Corynebacterium imitans]SNV70908.1 Uncharacterised protein [Corynebacterium imitans]